MRLHCGRNWIGAAVKLALPEHNKTILASKYQLYLPTKEQLISEINEVKRLAAQSEKDKLSTEE